MQTKIFASALLSATLLTAQVRAQTPLGTAVSYQGQIKQAGALLDGAADFQFKLFGEPTGGTQVGSTQSFSDVDVTDGLFAVELDFGASAFSSDKRWLEVAVRSPAGSGAFTTLDPRQELTATPYALQVRGMTVTATGLSVPGNISATGVVAAAGYASNSPLLLYAPAGVERMRINDING